MKLLFSLICLALLAMVYLFLSSWNRLRRLLKRNAVQFPAFLVAIAAVSLCSCAGDPNSANVAAIKGALNGLSVEKRFENDTSIRVGYEGDSVYIAARVPLGKKSVPIPAPPPPSAPVTAPDADKPPEPVLATK